MTISAFAAAKRLCERSDWSISNLELQKLLYIAHMFYMGEHDGEPLIAQRFEAWNYGPVQPDVYHRAKVFGSDPVGNVFHSVPSLNDSAEAKLLDSAYQQLGASPPGKLVAITHWEKGAWAHFYRHGERGTVIPNEAILAEFRERERAARERVQAQPA